MLKSVRWFCARLWPLLIVALFLPACCGSVKVAEPVAPAAEAAAPAAKPAAPATETPTATAAPVAIEVTPKAVAPLLSEGAAFGPLVNAAWLAARLEDPGIRTLDVRGDAFAYDAGHVPGAVLVDKAALAQLLDDPPGMPETAEAMAALFRDAGVSDATTVVIYDASTSAWAGRLFWALEYLGHDDVRVLDGGWTRWTCEMLPTQTEKVTPAPGDLTPRVREDRLATKDWVLANLANPTVLFLDVRSPAEYTGEEAMAERGGHIPGAVNLEWKLMLAEDGSGTLLPFESVLDVLTTAGVTPDREVVTYCQIGGRAAHTYLVLKLAGFEKVRLYEGSWAEWGNDPILPIETAP